ncbi:solute carrier family 25 member 35-like [Teleopsis dalmanni]|uniref:solute carrier family 25 member 35-like n=1 Tax=Teleopsis dalmanni TaxID=139649 RepID=UPI0018CE49AD|nr:solute carrier family 25 member 35-like [Teleopsis dalmanni]XP_037949387.1 solute carrier family 25 member 35-like [Teleopsis dalmanni]
MDSDFVLGGIASMAATFFTNPIEVIKTRIQLQGELAARGTYVVPYKGVLHAFYTVAKNDGLLGLQKGLVPALYFQFIINSFRLSIYTTAMDNGWMHKANGDVSFGRGLFWGAAGGVIGSYFSSPFFMIKTQLQSQAAKQIAVGYQHTHNGMMDALKQIYSKGGFFGLWRGSVAAIPRAAIGSGAQIATFGKTKALLVEYNLVTQPTLNSFSAGLIAGSIMSLAITPPDVITTRLYNQGVDEHGRGLYYRGWLDCFVKISRAEGLYGLYKGFWANYLRLAPHSTLVLLFFDELIAIRNRYRNKLKQDIIT